MKVRMPRGQVAVQNQRALNWQLECEAINRNKARRIRRAGWRKRVLSVLSITGSAYVALLVHGLWQSGQLLQMQERLYGWGQHQLVQTGMVVEQVSIKGQQKLSAEMVVSLADIQPNTLMFELSLRELKEKLEAHPHIASVQLERFYPSELRIEIVERQPVAIWQHKGEKHWVDAEGVVLESEWGSPSSAQSFTVITGEGAAKHLPDLMEILSASEALKSRVVAAQWVGGRRWNMVLKDGVKVLLPADAATQAWRAVETLDQNYALLERAVKQIDMRIDGRVFVKFDEEDVPSASPSYEMVTAMMVH